MFNAIKTKGAYGLIALVVAALGIFALAGCSGSASSSAASSPSAEASADTQAVEMTEGGFKATVDPSDPYGSGIHHATLTVEGYDPITIELNADDAPVTVANFCSLANDGFYNGLTFYRFAEGFCMQGGSSNNSAAATNDGLTPILGEFSLNGVNNPLADNFKKGTVAMARTSDNNSADSTFFVTLESDAMVSQSLDGRYAAFGTIDADGMAVVDQIVADYLPNVDDPSMGSIDAVADQAKIVSITITD